ncbi:MULTISPECIES: helix-turn-helix transcriptional regulator [Bradyrhizobium]|jgi:AraC family transcriptional regulator, activator of mtrCDE|uniref:helix-turn-helix transcriptional regulator n=1 Tax=Bradyrhizobium TaxID=374 RepID=UPI000480F370|nr:MULTISPECIES: helix-turn-helix domain-containing protein [Bradyrhizobium]MCS3446074.1 AraC family transcriptional activator of mtrCDE [Bradyrhizobium elkanii]MCS3562794.1 AraC family transcriptional activator of mtrCDE [Bradyrhizobium elkanii]MCW2147370.1 AraC family transcriptional activator of mtrCDE [Bradyrhizobium elkanii]MCW2353548.1 AraC family transcriptional activator of mtrCDE [Bradyrhizobium elkanii]MCW2371096.1 AraC family transcriptional activator of mtrCDE [Bradyrhizobium elkan
MHTKAVLAQAVVGQNAFPPARSTVKLSATDLNNLMQDLDIDVIALTELLVPRSHRVEMGMIDAPGIHYNLSGVGHISINGGPKIQLSPHLLIIVPPNTPFTIEVDGDGGPPKLISRDCWTRQEGILRVAVPNELPEIVQICGFFNASFGQSVRLFADLREPVIEQFEPADRIDLKLREAMDELLQQEVGVGAMTASLLKQIIVALVRRSLRSSERWTERFSILADRQLSRAFAEMVARPGAGHSVQSLAHSAGLSRSAFMARFSEVFGRTPMAILRDLRMRQAAIDLATTTTSIDVVAQNAGYESRSSFARAFRKAYDRDPSDYRRMARHDDARKDI